MATGNRGEGRGQGSAREHADEAKSHLQQAGSHAKEAASAATSGAAQKAQDTASGIGQRVQDAASGAAQKAADLASTASDKADDALSSVGQRMSGAASTLRQSAPREGMMGTAASTVADSLDAGGRYLQSHGLSDMSDDLAGVIRRNPMPSLLVAFGFGFLIGMASRR